MYYCFETSSSDSLPVCRRSAIRWFAHDWLAVSSDTEGLHVMVTLFALLEICLKVRHEDFYASSRMQGHVGVLPLSKCFEI